MASGGAAPPSSQTIKQLLEARYARVHQRKEEREKRKEELEQRMDAMRLDEEKKSQVLDHLASLESEHVRSWRKKMSVDAFEQMDIIGRGAFGEVRLVRERESGNVYAMKKLRKSEMVSKGQVHHVRTELDAMSEVDDSNPWVVKLHYSFSDDDFLYLAIDVTDDTFIVGEHCWECGVQVAFEVAGSAAGAAAGVLQDKRSDDPAISREIDMSMGLKQKQTQCRSPNADTRKVDGVDTECCVSYSTKVSGAGEWGLQLTKAAVLRNENNRHTT